MFRSGDTACFQFVFQNCARVAGAILMKQKQEKRLRTLAATVSVKQLRSPGTTSVRNIAHPESLCQRSDG